MTLNIVIIVFWQLMRLCSHYTEWLLRRQENHAGLGFLLHTRTVILARFCRDCIKRSKDADGNENVKKTIGLISKTTTLHVHHAFLYISLKFYFSYCTWIWCLGIQL